MSFVSENNSLSGYKTCIEALKHPMYTWLRRVTSGLRRCSIQDSRMVIALPILRLHHPGTWNNMTFLISSSSSEFSRSDAGALWCSPPPPQHVGLKRSREFSHGSVLCLGFLFVGGGFHRWLFSFFSRKRLVTLTCSRSMAEIANPLPWKGQLGALPLCVTGQGRAAPNLRVFRDFVILWCLSHGSSHFY